MISWGMVPCVIFEDEHLLAVNKPAGWNTHAPAPFAGEGIYDWLKHREARWSSLAIIHRLDKETSGVMVFGKTPLANRSLTEQFAQRRVRKSYVLLTDREVPRKDFTARSSLVRVGEKYLSRAGGVAAETRFVAVSEFKPGPGLSHLKMMSALPLTGRTHQIRVHAAENGFPILGDTMYGGTASGRVFLHAVEIALAHPATGAPLRLSAPADFDADPRLALRRAFLDPGATDACRLIHGASDGWPGWLVDKLGGFLLSQSEIAITALQQEELARLGRIFPVRGAYHKILSRQVRIASKPEASPQRIFGEAAPPAFSILENGIRYELSFAEGYSLGLFLDQRDNRRRLLTGHVAADFRLPELGNPQAEVLNVFAYTCGFSVCAAKAGARTTSLDLSRKYLEWGTRNFALNGLASEGHDFIYGDAFDWLRRLAKKGRVFDVVVLDPPTFSKSKEHGIFRVEKDLGGLVAAALPLIKPNGVLLAAANAATWPAQKFAVSVETAARAGRRSVVRQHYVPQPPDFPVSHAEPAYLKTLWMRIA
jgi:23S rRNA (cytosine1962-C5)-methyltransferase